MDSPGCIQIRETGYYMLINKSNKKALYLPAESPNYEKQALTFAEPNQRDMGQVWMLISLPSDKSSQMFEIVHAASTFVLTTGKAKHIHLSYGKMKPNQLFSLQAETHHYEENLYVIKDQKQSYKCLTFDEETVVMSEVMMISVECMWEVVAVKKNPLIDQSCIIEKYEHAMVLDVPKAKISPGVNICLYPWNNRFNQRWKLIKVNEQGGCYLIQNLRSKLYLDVKGAKSKRGVYIIQWEANKGKNQLWKLEKVNHKIYLIRSVMEQSLYLGCCEKKPQKQSYVMTSDVKANSLWRILGHIPE